VNTAPEKTIAGVADHGVITGNTVQRTYPQAAAVFAGLREVGVDLDDVFTVLGTEGVDKFIASWNELLDSVATELAKHQHDVACDEVVRRSSAQ
jgi:transaldolase